ncbi:DNA-directed RNA polymerase III subunit RPC3 isoform X2 [Drosophila obscura]|uniref:DNA-directed RNA polymerase III subunit RPC3 isoform X2 n=1 Tax=Drosophila obscura TaxID=7282 RepID=UPI001BB25041|nr:DNA-directed RNA polymerase III subunit RPC3 isoform X2 [Drosophila obscura]
MSADYAHLCSAIVEQCFGKVSQSVTDCLFSATTRTLSQIANATKFSRKEVGLALSVLIKFRLVNFEASKLNPFVPEYSLRRPDILCLLRYPRYIHMVQTKYGNVGASIAEELINAGSDTASAILIKCLSEGETKADGAESHRNTFLQMITDHYIIKRPELILSEEQDEVLPKFESNECDYFRHPNVDLQLIEKIRKGEATLAEAGDSAMIWNINYDRFHQDFRDSIMIDSIERKLGENASECFRFILKIMYKTTDPWQRVETFQPNHFCGY